MADAEMGVIAATVDENVGEEIQQQTPEKTKRERRSWLVSEKRRLAEEYQACDRIGRKALLVREDIYHGTMALWCRQLAIGLISPDDAGTRVALSSASYVSQLSSIADRLARIESALFRLKARNDTISVSSDATDNVNQPAM